MLSQSREELIFRPDGGLDVVDRVLDGLERRARLGMNLVEAMMAGCFISFNVLTHLNLREQE